MRIADDLHKYKAVATNVCKQILAAHMHHILKLLEREKQSGKRKVCLKLLIAIVMQGTSIARDFMLSFNFNDTAVLQLWAVTSEQVIT